ncbi:MAG TPA: hypothetical protein VF659_21090 [Pyrinomonadaceae bacterium]|jgi:hypothetical protein
MKSIRCLGFSLALLALGAAPAVPQTPCSLGTEYKGCRACGTAKGKKGQQLNVEKNRDEAAANPRQITVEELRAPGNNKKFSPDERVWVTAYVAKVGSGGDQESCNCGRDDLRDIHIDIVASPSEVNDLSKHVVVEFTPRWQEKFGLNPKNYQKMLKAVRADIEHRWVKFEGWLLYDYIHANESKSTQPNLKPCPNDGKIHDNCNWRATPWEIHPVTSYAKVPAPH